MEWAPGNCAVSELWWIQKNTIKVASPFLKPTASGGSQRNGWEHGRPASLGTSCRRMPHVDRGRKQPRRGSIHVAGWHCGSLCPTCLGYRRHLQHSLPRVPVYVCTHTPMHTPHTQTVHTHVALHTAWGDMLGFQGGHDLTPTADSTPSPQLLCLHTTLPEAWPPPGLLRNTCP